MLKEQSGVSGPGPLKGWRSGLDPTLKVTAIACRPRNHPGVGGLAGGSRDQGARTECHAGLVS